MLSYIAHRVMLLRLVAFVQKSCYVQSCYKRLDIQLIILYENSNCYAGCSLHSEHLHGPPGVCKMLCFQVHKAIITPNPSFWRRRQHCQVSFCLTLFACHVQLQKATTIVCHTASLQTISTCRACTVGSVFPAHGHVARQHSLIELCNAALS